MISKSFKIVEPRRFDLYIEDIIPLQGESLVKIDYASICKADLRYYVGERDSRVLGLKYPMNLIHEATGIILSDESGKFKVGDRVVFVPNIVSGQNKCQNCVCHVEGLEENYCPDAQFASSNIDGFSKEIINYPTTHLIKVPSKLESNIAVFTELVSVAVASYRRLNLLGNEVIGVWGDGILGYILCAVLRMLHPNGKIIAVGKHVNKIRLFPADEYFLINDYEIKNKNIHVAFECVGGLGSASAINEAIEVVNVGGRIVLTGVSENAVPINTRMILEKGIILAGVTRSNVKDFQQAISLFYDDVFKQTISLLILKEFLIENIVDYYNAFEWELKNKELGKAIMRLNV